MSDTKEILRMLRDEPNWNPSFGPGGLSRHEAKVWHETCVKAADEIERLQTLHLERTKTTHKALCERDEKIERLEARVAELQSDIELWQKVGVLRERKIERRDKRIAELEGAINRAGGLALQQASHELIRQVLAETLKD